MHVGGGSGTDILTGAKAQKAAKHAASPARIQANSAGKRPEPAYRRTQSPLDANGIGKGVTARGTSHLMLDATLKTQEGPAEAALKDPAAPIGGTAKDGAKQLAGALNPVD